MLWQREQFSTHNWLPLLGVVDWNIDACTGCVVGEAVAVEDEFWELHPETIQAPTMAIATARLAVHFICEC